MSTRRFSYDPIERTFRHCDIDSAQNLRSAAEVREFDVVFDPEAQRDFWLRLDDIAHDIALLLQEYLERS